MDIALSYVADPEIKTILQLMLDGQVVLFRVGINRGVLCRNGGIGTVSSSTCEWSIHRNLGRTSRLRIGCRTNKRIFREGAGDI